MNLKACYSVARGVAIRPERFGGLVYRYDNRRLYFLHSHAMVDFIRGLDGKRPLETVLDDFLVNRGLPETARETLVNAVAQLEKLELLVSSTADDSIQPAYGVSRG